MPTSQQTTPRRRAISIIAAVARNGVIGRGGDLPWRLSADLIRFKRLTMGHTMVMGRKTYESIGRLLPGRTTVIVSRQADYQVEGAIVVDSLEAALKAPALKNHGPDGTFGNENFDDEIFIVGGGEIYRQAFPLATRLYLTEVDANVAGDTYFPDWPRGRWRLVRQTRRPADEKNAYPFYFRTYEPIAMNPTETELLDLNARLLASVGGGDWETYTQLCDPTLTCFEPEARGRLVQGMGFHKFYFDLEHKGVAPNYTMTQPHVRLLGDTAIVSYVRLTQFVDAQGTPATVCCEETRVWQKTDDGWKHVHFHRSANA